MKSWHARKSMLTYIQSMVFCNLFLMSEVETRRRLQAQVMDLLSDEQLEVTHCGGSTCVVYLGGLCGRSIWKVYSGGLCGRSIWKVYSGGLCGRSIRMVYSGGLCGRSIWMVYSGGLSVAMKR